MDWLRQRLTPKKGEESRWTELAFALSAIWEEFYDPLLSRLERLRSCYLADDEDLIKKIREIGDYFSYETPEKKDRPVALAWRRLELDYKELEHILTSVFRRNYRNLPVLWFPIFAPLDKPYGVDMKVAEGPWPERQLFPPDGYFLTSRGRLGTDYGYLLTLDISKQKYLDNAIPLLRRTKPLHILYEGILWYIRFNLRFEGWEGNGLIDLSWERDWDWLEIPFAAGRTRFDYTPADFCPLDYHKFECDWHRESRFSVEFISMEKRFWRLDWHSPEGFPPNWVPLDYVRAGIEGEIVAPASLFLAKRKRTIPVSMPPFDCSMSVTRQEVQ